MTDRPLVPASRAGRPRTRAEHQTPRVPVAPKVDRPRSKSVFQPKVKDSTRKNPAKKKLVRPTPPVM